MKIYLGADHNGFVFKQQIADLLTNSGFDVVDSGDKRLDPNDDFPQFASRAVAALLADSDETSRVILLCGSGQGMCMAANRYTGIRAALGWSVEAARSSRNDDNSNVLCLPAEGISFEQIQPIVLTWLATPFAGAARFKRRLRELDELSR